MSDSGDALQHRLRREKQRSAVLERMVESKTRELNQLNEELRRQNDRLEEQVEARTVEMRAALLAAQMASNAKTSFLAQMSHELRTPLHGLSGTVDLLSRTALTGEQRQLIDLCQRSSTALLKVIGDVLDYSRIESGRVELELRPIDVRGVVESSVQSFEASAHQQGITLRSEIDAPPELFVIGDSHRLGQVLNNLISNALKFTAQGEVCVRLRAEVVEARVGLRWQVADTGCGMTEAQVHIVFEPFTQAEAAVTRKFGGAGLGLSIVHGLVLLMNGSIDVISKPGVGTTFTVVTEHDLATAVKPQAARDPGSAAWNGLRVLVVDDHPINRMVADAMLSELGCAVSMACDGEQAIAAVAKQSPDLVLMDCHMPGLSGAAATRVIKRRGYQGPVVAVSADVSAENRDSVEAAGMAMLLGKPFRRAELLRMLGAVVERPPAAGS